MCLRVQVVFGARVFADVYRTTLQVCVVRYFVYKLVQKQCLSSGEDLSADLSMPRGWRLQRSVSACVCAWQPKGFVCSCVCLPQCACVAVSCMFASVHVSGDVSVHRWWGVSQCQCVCVCWHVQLF